MRKITPGLTALAALTSLLPMAGQAAVTPLSVTGWTQDMIINAIDPTTSSYDTTVTGTLDGGAGTFEGFTFGEAGTYSVYVDEVGVVPTTVSGLSSTVYTSATGSGASFQFGDFSAANSLILSNGVSGELTLTSTSALTTLAIYGTTSGGPTSASVTFTFSDLSTSVYTIASGSGIGADWFNNGDNDAALVVGDRLSNRGEDTYTNLFYQENDSISIYESLITLSAEDQAKTVASITIGNTGDGRLAVMALSAEAVPEASTASLIAACGLIGLARRRRA